MTIEIEQVRAARELLGWTQERLAKAAAVNLSIIKNFESEQRLPSQETFTKIWGAFSKAGIAFESDGRFRGVRVKRWGCRSWQMPIDPRQSRAARKLLNWSQSRLANAALISYGALRNFEGDQRPTAQAKLLAILRAFSDAGIVFDSDKSFLLVKLRR